MRAILNFDKETCENIFSGKQKYVIRNQNFKEKIDTILMYETYSDGKIVGEFYVKSLERYDLKTLWGLTCHSNGMSESRFNDYLGYCGYGFFIEIGFAVKYVNPIDIYEVTTQRNMRHNCLYVD